MKPEHQRIAIAEACGWVMHSRSSWEHPEGYTHQNWGGLLACPDYLNDLNAMHEAEKRLLLGALEDFSLYCKWLERVVQEQEAIPFMCWIVKATAAQRAEAFLKTIGKWEGGES
jgi:uncharacterized protein YbaR (Trm112 family)